MYDLKFDITKSLKFDFNATNNATIEEPLTFNGVPTFGRVDQRFPDEYDSWRDTVIQSFREFGTNNLPDCSNMCHESSGKALQSTIGIGKGTVSLEDFNHADTILVIGQNPGTNHPRMLTALRDAKLKGAKIIHINPLPEAGLERFKHPQDYICLLYTSDAADDP